MTGVHASRLLAGGRCVGLAALLVALMAVVLAGCEPLPEDGPPPFPLNQRVPTAASALDAATPEADGFPAPGRNRVPTPTPTAVGGAPTALARAQAAAGDVPIVAPAEEEALLTLVLAEGRVRVYADTSRVEASAEALQRAQPELAVEVVAASSQDAYLELRADLARGDPGDLYLSSDPLRTAMLLEEGLLRPYLPATLEESLGEGDPELLAPHHWTATLLVYNSARGRRSPLENWWQLTEPEWRGRVAMADPILNERALYLLATVAAHPDEMAAAYRQAYGREVVLDDDCPDAAYQWIKALLLNEPVLLPGDAEVADFVGDPQAPGMRVGLAGSEVWSKVARQELALAAALEAEPSTGVRWRAQVGLLADAPHPHAATYLLGWLYGEGYAPWREPGFYAARADVPDLPASPPRDSLEPRLWEPDATWLRAALPAVRDHVAAHIGRPVGGRPEEAP